MNLGPGKKKRFELTLETVLVALFTERVGQRVPDRRTSNREGPRHKLNNQMLPLRHTHFSKVEYLTLLNKLMNPHKNEDLAGLLLLSQKKLSK